MKQIKEGLEGISLGIFFLGLFLGLGTCNQKVSSKTDFQYCFDYVFTWKGAEKSRICFEKLEQIQDEN